MLEWLLFPAIIYWITRDDSPPKTQRREVPSPAPSATRALVPAGLTIGHGGQAVVRHGVLGSQEVAIKTHASEQDAIAEEAVLRHLAHPNIVQVLKREGSSLYLERLVHSWHDQPCKDYGSAMRLTKDVGRALQHVHDAGFVHGDIKPPNVLTDAACRRSVVIDFASCVRDGAKRVGVTAGYAPQSAQLGQPCRKSEDIYSFACTLAWLLDPCGPLPSESRLNKLLVAMLSDTQFTIGHVVAEIDRIIETGDKCAACGYWKPADVNWCPSSAVAPRTAA